MKIGRQKEKYKTMKKQQHLPKRRGKILQEKKWEIKIQRTSTNNKEILGRYMGRWEWNTQQKIDGKKSKKAWKKIRQVVETRITEQELGKTNRKTKNRSAPGMKKYQISGGKHWNQHRKTSNGNTGMEKGSKKRTKKNTKTANARKNGAYIHD